MTKTIDEWLTYYSERYGVPYQIRIERENDISRLYYWWEKAPWELLSLTAKRVWYNNVDEPYGTRQYELEFIC